MSKYFLILALLASPSCFAELHKWTDENGKVHYSDQPPPSNVKAQKLRSGNTESSAPSTESKSLAEKDVEYKKTQQDKKAAADKIAAEKSNAAAMETNCTNAKQNLRNLQSGIRMSSINEKGERVFIDDEQRQQRITQTEQDITRFCK